MCICKFVIRRGAKDEIEVTISEKEINLHDQLRRERERERKIGTRGRAWDHRGVLGMG